MTAPPNHKAADQYQRPYHGTRKRSEVDLFDLFLGTARVAVSWLQTVVDERPGVNALA